VQIPKDWKHYRKTNTAANRSKIYKNVNQSVLPSSKSVNVTKYYSFGSDKHLPFYFGTDWNVAKSLYPILHWKFLLKKWYIVDRRNRKWANLAIHKWGYNDSRLSSWSLQSPAPATTALSRITSYTIIPNKNHAYDQCTNLKINILKITKKIKINYI